MRLVTVVVALVCAASEARADDVGIIVGGDGEAHAEVGARIESWLRARGMTVVAAPLSTDATNTLTNCFTLDDLVCARGVFEARSRTDTLVFVRIDARGKNATFNLYWFVKGKAPVGERRVCESCDAQARRALTDTMLQRTVAVTSGGGAGDSEARGSRLGPSLLLGAGVALLATGGIFLYYGSLDGANQKYVYPNASPIGIGIGTVGLGAAVGGAIWLWQSGPSSGPVASATRGGAYVGWAGRF